MKFQWPLRVINIFSGLRRVNQTTFDAAVCGFHVSYTGELKALHDKVYQFRVIQSFLSSLLKMQSQQKQQMKRAQVNYTVLKYKTERDDKEISQYAKEASKSRIKVIIIATMSSLKYLQCNLIVHVNSASTFISSNVNIS